MNLRNLRFCPRSVYLLNVDGFPILAHYSKIQRVWKNHLQSDHLYEVPDDQLRYYRIQYFLDSQDIDLLASYSYKIKHTLYLMAGLRELIALNRIQDLIHSEFENRSDYG